MDANKQLNRIAIIINLFIVIKFVHIFIRPFQQLHLCSLVWNNKLQQRIFLCIIINKTIIQAMDSRIYFHQYRRPRATNPTYVSSNVQNSITFFNGGSFPEQTSKREYTSQYNNQRAKTNSNIAPPPEPHRPQQNQSHSSRYQQMQQYETQRQVPSKLSGYGERSLMMDQRGIHDKQTSKFDIISLKPREHSQQIKQYPRLTLENRDDIYYRRMSEMYNNGAQNRSKTYQKQPIGNVAGRHTYDLQQKISIDPQRGNPRYFTPKMMNHMDELQHNLA